MRTLLIITMGLLFGSTSYAADHKASLFLSETGGFYALKIGKDSTPNMQTDQHPDGAAGILFTIAANGQDTYEIIQSGSIIAKGTFYSSKFIAEYLLSVDTCAPLSIQLKDKKGKVTHKTPMYFECME